MPKRVTELQAIEVKRLAAPGFHSVGGVAGLYLRIADSKAKQTTEAKPVQAKSWILRTMIGSTRHDVGLGSYPEVSLADAREKAANLREQIRQGINPIAKRKQDKAHVEWTFGRCADEYIKLHRAGWKNAKHADQWVNTLGTYANPVIGNKHVKDVTVGDVLAIIEPHWTTKNETMVRLRNRIELVLGWAGGRGYRDKVNPAAWKGNLEHILPKPSKVNQRENFAALPYKQISGLWSRLTELKGTGATALRFLILTACRHSDAVEATWDEIDMDAGLWVIPAARMKASREHRVPLSTEAMELLQSLPRFVPAEGQPDLLFLGRYGKALSNSSLRAVLYKQLKISNKVTTVHGLRSSFADWRAEQTTYSHELAEMALAHTLGDKTREAYQRTDMMERRRQMMQDWARYVTTKQNTATVTSIKSKSAA